MVKVVGLKVYNYAFFGNELFGGVRKLLYLCMRKGCVRFGSRRGRLRTRARPSKSPLKGDFVAGEDACVPGQDPLNLP